MYSHENNLKKAKFKYQLFLVQQIKAESSLKLNEGGPNHGIFFWNFSKRPMRNYLSKKIGYNYIDEIWSIFLVDLTDYKISNRKGFRYIYIQWNR